jgi:hypothetical protein
VGAAHCAGVEIEPESELGQQQLFIADQRCAPPAR